MAVTAGMIPAWVEGVLQPVEKLAAHQRGLRHMAVSVFVLAGDHVLIQQRAAGISGLTLIPAGQVEYRADVGGGLTEHELVDVFVAEADTSLPLALDPDEVQAVRWVALRDLLRDLAENPAPFTPWLQIYMDRHRAQIFGSRPPL